VCCPNGRNLNRLFPLGGSSWRPSWLSPEADAWSLPLLGRDEFNASVFQRRLDLPQSSSRSRDLTRKLYTLQSRYADIGKLRNLELAQAEQGSGGLDLPSGDHVLKLTCWPAIGTIRTNIEARNFENGLYDIS
jgi:hypothetical protein